jgi:hypothetical protein
VVEMEMAEVPYGAFQATKIKFCKVKLRGAWSCKEKNEKVFKPLQKTVLGACATKANEVKSEKERKREKRLETLQKEKKEKESIYCRRWGRRESVREGHHNSLGETREPATYRWRFAIGCTNSWHSKQSRKNKQKGDLNHSLD